MAPLEDNEEAQSALHRLIYDVAKVAKEKLDYPTAIARFDSLGDYEDAAAQKTDSIDLYGRQLMREGKYQAACDQFMQIADTGDAIALIRQCRYALGLEKQQAGDYEEAAALFESLGIYEDAQTRGQICRYTAGTNALSAGELEKAAEQLLAAGDYQDAAQKFADVATTLGNAALEAGDNQTADRLAGTAAGIGRDADRAEPRGVCLRRATGRRRAEGSRRNGVLFAGHVSGCGGSRQRAGI